MKIKRIGPMSLGRVASAIYAVLGLILGVFFAVITLFSTQIPSPSWMFGVGAVVIFPVLYGVMGFVFGFLVALLYNFIAKKVGGIELDVE